jgi:hypothetical protein
MVRLSSLVLNQNIVTECKHVYLSEAPAPLFCLKYPTVTLQSYRIAETRWLPFPISTFWYDTYFNMQYV